jgi:hypothetical protein
LLLVVAVVVLALVVAAELVDLEQHRMFLFQPTLL